MGTEPRPKPDHLIDERKFTRDEPAILCVRGDEREREVAHLGIQDLFFAIRLTSPSPAWPRAPRIRYSSP